jgi:oligoendopeptidase F
MSKQTKKGNSFTYTPTQNPPKLPNKVPTNWDMKGLYYQSINDPQIEKDVTATEKAFATFVKKYKNSDFTTNPKVLADALGALNKIDETPTVAKPTRYLSLLTALNSDDEAATKKLSLLGQRLQKASNNMLFFGIELAKVSKSTQKELLAAPELAPYKYDLQTRFESAKHILTESEEKIIRLLSDCSYGMWVESTEKMLGRKSITYKGKTLPVNSAFDTLTSLPLEEQPAFWNLLMEEIGTLDEVVENELTAVCTRKKISDELRGYKKPYSASVIDHEDDEKSVEALIEAVSTKGFALSKKFYKLKAKLHGVDKLAYAQRSAQLNDAPVIDFTQATEICRDVFYGVNPIYGERFDHMLVNGQIDVYPKQGKRGGAFCWGDISQPTNVFLNQADTLRSLETYAHEMGHAIHTERSKVQPAHYQGYSTTTAETASTLFEGLLFDAVLAQSNEADKATLLHDKLSGDIATVQRQIAFFNFELEMHTTVREQGGITRTELNQMMQKHLKSYCGPAITIDEQDGNSYIYVSHFRYGFYVYTYTFGMLMSSVMAEKFTADNAYAKQIDTFLTAGGSDTVANIFKSIGLNTKKIETFEYGLNKMEQEIKLLQKLTK